MPKNSYLLLIFSRKSLKLLGFVDYEPIPNIDESPEDPEDPDDDDEDEDEDEDLKEELDEDPLILNGSNESEVL